MKFGELRSIGHNMADSLADGNGLLIGTYVMDVFGEAKRSAVGFIEVDLLTGVSSGAIPSPSLARAFELYAKALPRFCEKHGVSSAAFRTLSARFFGDGHLRQFIVTVENQEGRRATDKYAGVPGKRIKVLDRLGRVRKKPTDVNLCPLPPREAG